MNVHNPGHCAQQQASLCHESLSNKEVLDACTTQAALSLSQGNTACASFCASAHLLSTAQAKVIITSGPASSISARAACAGGLDCHDMSECYMQNAGTSTRLSGVRLRHARHGI